MAQVFMEGVKEITECCICNETFKDPKMLPCIHTFCLRCLQKTAVSLKRNPGDAMSCPLCRKEFIIPKNGMTDLPRNFFIERFIEIATILTKNQNSALCESCPGTSEYTKPVTRSAISYCIHCHKSLCDMCCHYHTQFPQLKSHQLVPLGSQFTEELQKNFDAQCCEKHEEEKLKMYCSDCKTVICLVCFAEAHKSHECLDIKVAAETFRKRVKNHIAKMNNFSKEALTETIQLDEQRTSFLISVADTEQDILRRREELKSLVDKCSESLLIELATARNKIWKEIESEREKNELHKVIIESFKAYCSFLVTKGSASEVCRSIQNLASRVVEIEEMWEKQNERQIRFASVSFEASNLEDLMKNENTVGKIREFRKSETKNKEPSEEQHKPVSIQAVKSLDFPSYSQVHGLTKLKNNIYVLCENLHILCENTHSIYVFEDQMPFRRLKEVKLNDILNPCDIIVSPNPKCLYVSDYRNKCIWKITEDDRVTKWLTDVTNPLTLSLSCDGHLLKLARGETCSQLEIYRSDAKLIRRISLQSSIHSPQHAIQKPNGQFVVSHRLEDGADECWVISELSCDGQLIIGQFKPDDESQKLNYPCHMCLDSENNRLFVADFRNHAVILFDSDSLKFNQILLKEETNGIEFPNALSYNEKTKQLFVGQIGNVDVWELK